MKKLALLAVFLALPLAIAGQTTSPTASVTSQANGDADVAGLLYASNFAHWTIAPTPSGTRWDNPGQCYGTSGGVVFPLFSTRAPITIVDIGTPANTETVTPSIASYVGAGCSVGLPATHTHVTYYLQSGTLGLQEALNWAGVSRAVVVLTPDWQTMGGTTAMVTAAIAGANTSILDARTATLATYTGTTPALASGSVGAGVTITATAGVPSANCTVGSLDVNTSAVSASTVLYVCGSTNVWSAVTVP
jgi:hypothetical protein